MALTGAPPQTPDGPSPIGPPPSSGYAPSQAAGDGPLNLGPLPRPSGSAPLTPWRVAIFDRAARLHAALDRLPTAATSADGLTVRACIAEALTAARYLPANVPRPPRLRNAL